MQSIEQTAFRDEGYIPRLPPDALPESDPWELGLVRDLPPEALDEEEDARWSYLPFLQLAIERMCVMALLAEDHEVDVAPLDEAALSWMRQDGEEDPVFARAAQDYLAALATLASMSGRGEGEWHRLIAGLYLGGRHDG